MDILKTSSLFLLFIFHSYFFTAYPNQAWTIGTYLLGAFFLISGMLLSGSNKKYSAYELLKRKLVRVYIPYLLFLALYAAAFFWQSADHKSFVYYATGLSVVDALQNGSLNLQHLWFIPQLIVYFILFLALWKLIKSERNRLYAVIGIFLALVILWCSNLPYRLEWRFMAYLLVFYAGMVLGETGRLSSFYDTMKRRKTSIFLIALTLFSGILVFVLDENMLRFNAWGVLFLISARTSFAILACMTSLFAFRRINIKAIKKACYLVSSASVFIYLLQPIVSHYTSCLLFSATYCSGSLNLFGETTNVIDTAIMIPISFFATIFLALALQRIYELALRLT